MGSAPRVAQGLKRPTQLRPAPLSAMFLCCAQVDEKLVEEVPISDPAERAALWADLFDIKKGDLRFNH